MEIGRTQGEVKGGQLSNFESRSTTFFIILHSIHTLDIMASPLGQILRTVARSRASSFFSNVAHGQAAAVSLQSRSRWIHSSSTCLQPRKPKNAHGGGIRDRLHFGDYSRLAPLSLKLGVTPPDVDSLVPPHILRPSYAARGEPSEWASGIPINTPETIQKARKAGQLAKKILELGGTLVKVN